MRGHARQLQHGDVRRNFLPWISRLGWHAVACGTGRVQGDNARISIVCKTLLSRRTFTLARATDMCRTERISRDHGAVLLVERGRHETPRRAPCLSLPWRERKKREPTTRGEEKKRVRAREHVRICVVFLVISLLLVKMNMKKYYTRSPINFSEKLHNSCATTCGSRILYIDCAAAPNQ